MGISSARNAGLIVAKAPYIALMDSDDVAWPHRFTSQHAWMESHPELAVCCSNAFKVFSNGNRISMLYPEFDDIIKSRLLFVDSAIINPTVMLRTDFIRKGIRGI